MAAKPSEHVSNCAKEILRRFPTNFTQSLSLSEYSKLLTLIEIQLCACILDMPEKEKTQERKS